MSKVRVIETRSCPACGGADWDSVPLGEPPLRRCTACQLVYAAQYADPDDLYVDGYLFGGTETALDVSHPLFQAFLAEAAEKRMRLIEAITRQRTMLDVGCGAGEVLAVAKDRGWQVAGVEPVAQSARYAVETRGLDVRAALLEESGIPERSFDVVSAFHVVEHMSDATAFLRLIARWAKPGGLVVVEVPNWRSLNRMSSHEAWTYLRPLEHIGHYTPATLRATLRRAELDPVVIKTPGFLSRTQTLGHQLVDLGIPQRPKLIRLLGRQGEHNGEPAIVPRRSAARMLRGVQHVYDRAGVGQVVFAASRVPS